MKASTDWKEQIPPDEEARFEELGERLSEVHRQYNAKYGKGRFLHRKSLGALRASVTIDADIVPEARFAADDSTSALWHFDEGTGNVALDEVDGLEVDLLNASWVAN